MKKHLNIFLGLILTSVMGFAQEAHILYGFEGVAQSSLMNPAHRGTSNVTIGLPVLNSVNVKFTSQLAALGDLENDGSQDNIALIDKIAEMEGNNHNYQFSRISLFFVGFKAGEKGYFSLGADHITESAVSVPSELLQLGVLGNRPFLNETLDLSGLGVHSYQMVNYHIGYSHQIIEDKLRVGVRLKFISGLTGAKTDISSLTYRVEEGDTIPFIQTLNGAGTIYTSGITAEGSLIQNAEGSLIQNPEEIDYSLVFASPNRGYGIDLGVDYQLNEKWSFSASALDLGTVNWTSSLESYDFMIDSLVFDGLSFNLITDSIDGAIDAFEDDVDNRVSLDTKQKSFSSRLNADYFVGAHWRFHPNHQLTAVYQHSDVFDQTYDAISLSYYGMLTNWANVKFSYAYGFEGVQNVGAGVTLGAQVQLYLMGNYLNYVSDLASVDRFSLRFGVNINLGYPDNIEKRQLKKEEKRQRKEAEQQGGGDTGSLLWDPWYRG